MKPKFFLGKIRLGAVEDWHNWRTMERSKITARNGKVTLLPSARRAFSYATDEAETYVIRHKGKRCMLRFPKRTSQMGEKRSREFALQNYLETAIAQMLFPQNFLKPLGIMHVKLEEATNIQRYGMVTEIVRPRNVQYKDAHQWHYRVLKRSRHDLLQASRPQTVIDMINLDRSKDTQISLKTAQRIVENAKNHRITISEIATPEFMDTLLKSGIEVSTHQANVVQTGKTPVFLEVEKITAAVLTEAKKRLPKEKAELVELLFDMIAKSKDRLLQMTREK